MAGQGKYTQYRGNKELKKNQLLGKLFKDENSEKSETEAMAAAVAKAKQFLTPDHQTADVGHFSLGVDMTFSGAPELKDVKWKNAGDPANPYTPDISSPGPGKTLGTEKDADPGLKPEDLKPDMVVGAKNSGTVVPAKARKGIIDANILGSGAKLGDSGGND